MNFKTSYPEEYSKRNEEILLLKDKLPEIIETIYKQYGIDFSEYAEASFSRRILHVSKIFSLENIDALLGKIRKEPDFQKLFVNELTVSATEMFRDPTFWIALKRDIFPLLGESNDEITFWINGCSTGEEVFSLAIALSESNLLDKVKIIATDLDSVSLEIASSGFYYNHTYEQNQSNYKASEGLKSLDAYFTRSGLGYTMNPSLLKNVEFKIHDLVKDNSDQQYDLVLCRNVMIYFNQDLQKRVLKKLKTNLKKGAFLALGAKESIMWLDHSESYKPINREEKIYRIDQPDSTY